MQTEKEKWIDEVLQSLDGSARAEAPDMTDTVMFMSRLDTAGRYTIPTPTDDNALLWRIAASVVFLMLLNVVTIYGYQHHIQQQTQETVATRAAAAEFGLGQSASGDPGSIIFGN